MRVKSEKIEILNLFLSTYSLLTLNFTLFTVFWVRAGYKPSSVSVVIHLRSAVAGRLLRSLPVPPLRPA